MIRRDRDRARSIEAATKKLIKALDPTPFRQGLSETPKRVAKAWLHWTSGYADDPKEVFKVFEDGAEVYDEMVLVGNIPFYSHCEHHLAQFFGTVTIGYIPVGKVVGLSKFARLVDIFGRRLQVQERMTGQIADAIHSNLNPRGVGVIIKARHLCMESRGVQKQGHHTETCAIRGVMKTDRDARSEFLVLARNGS